MAKATLKHRGPIVTLKLTEREANIVAAILNGHGCYPAENPASLDEEVNAINQELCELGYDGFGFVVCVDLEEEDEDGNAQYVSTVLESEDE